MGFHDAVSILSREVSVHLTSFRIVPTLAFLAMSAGIATSSPETPALANPLLPNL